MNRLIEGFRRFRQNYFVAHRDIYQQLTVEGQTPRAMVIGCCDSRVDPQLIFDAKPGEMFIVRNVANLVPPFGPSKNYHGTSAAIEFAVRGLGVKHIIVLGHAQCGGIGALMRADPGDKSDFISAWMAIAAPARERARAAGDNDGTAVQRRCEHESIKVSLANLMTFPWVREAVERGDLAVHGWYFDLEAGNLLSLDSDGTFRPV
ncbi:MAG: carbonic anhydrase [Rhodospirillales bacterium]|nr:carbonic anhydrase [Rhodospirillales bacterium]